MKFSARTSIAQFITRLSLAVMLLAGLAQAQSATWVVKANIPFEFAVGKKIFPAGNYSIVRTSPNQLSLRDAKAGVVAVMISMPVQAAERRSEPTLVFRTDSGEAELVRVWYAGSHYGSELAPGRPKLALAKAQAGKDSSTNQP